MSSKTLYELFSEFVSMILLSESPSLPYNPDDVYKDVLPVRDNQRMSKYHRDKQMLNAKTLKFEKLEIPIAIIKKYCIIIKAQN